MSPQVRETKAKCDCIKLKSFCTEKKIINKMKKLSIEWERIFANDIANCIMNIKLYKYAIQLSIRKNNLIKIRQTLS